MIPLPVWAEPTDLHLWFLGLIDKSWFEAVDFYLNLNRIGWVGAAVAPPRGIIVINRPPS